MKKNYFSFLILAISLLSLPVFSQTENKKTDDKSPKDTTLLGLPGDNLDLYLVLDLFQKSKTIEEFEKNLNLEKTGINNLELDLNNKVDFIKVDTKKKDDDFTFVLQVDISKTEKQDVAVILVSKDKDKKITMQIVGDKDLYGKDFIVELKDVKTPSSTPNPGYTGSNPDTVYVPAKTTTVVVEQAPIVQYVYSPAYVPYAPPYYYGYYPPYFAAFTVMAVGMYWGSHAYHHHHGGYGYHGNTTVIHNSNNFNNYNNSRNTSNTVRDNSRNGNYDRGNGATQRPSNGAGGVNRPSQGGGNNRPSSGAGAAGLFGLDHEPLARSAGAARIGLFHHPARGVVEPRHRGARGGRPRARPLRRCAPAAAARLGHLRDDQAAHRGGGERRWPAERPRLPHRRLPPPGARARCSRQWPARAPGDEQGQASPRVRGDRRDAAERDDRRAGARRSRGGGTNGR